jgi:predicted metalloprotease
MRWRRMRRTPDVIDQRAARPGRARSPFPLPGGAKVGVPGGLGLVGLLIFLAIQLLGGGSSAFEQRTKWFRVGQERGEPEECDTFRVDEP